MAPPTDVDISNFINGTFFNPLVTGPLFALLWTLRSKVREFATPSEEKRSNKQRRLPGIFTSKRLYKIVRNLFILGIVFQINDVLNELALNNYEWSSSAIVPQDQIVVVTGGSGGIGQHYVQNFADRKFGQIVIMDIAPPTYTLPPNTHYFKTDLTNGTQIEVVAQEIQDKVGHPTVLVHNAGTRIFGHTILTSTEKLLKLTFDVNVIASILVTKQFLPAMIEKNSGHIVTMASLAGYTTPAQLIDYSASKIAAAAFSEGLYQELKHRYNAPNVRNTLVNPTWVKTGLTDAFHSLNHGMSTIELDPDYVANTVIDQVVKNRSAQLYMPSLYGFSAALRGWPNWIQERIRDDTKNIIVFENKL